MTKLKPTTQAVGLTPNKEVRGGRCFVRFIVALLIHSLEWRPTSVAGQLDEAPIVAAAEAPTSDAIAPSDAIAAAEKIESKATIERCDNFDLLFFSIIQTQRALSSFRRNDVLVARNRLPIATADAKQRTFTHDNTHKNIKLLSIETFRRGPKQS